MIGCFSHNSSGFADLCFHSYLLVRFFEESFYILLSHPIGSSLLVEQGGSGFMHLYRCALP